MEARRLAILCSHICPVGSGLTPTRLASVSASNCSEDYQREEKKKNNNIDCVFCKIVRGESQAFKLYEDDTCMCILDTNPLSRGHSLIIPKAHFSSLDETPPSVISAMCSKVPFISSAIVKATDSDSFNLLVNNGAAAGQVIFHTHIHIIPRKARDCLWASESLQRYPLKLDKEATRLVNSVREHLSLSLSLSNDCKDIEGESSNVVRN